MKHYRQSINVIDAREFPMSSSYVRTLVEFQPIKSSVQINPFYGAVFGAAIIVATVITFFIIERKYYS